MNTSIIPAGTIPANTLHVVGTPAGVPVSERAMLVDLTIKKWSAAKHDKKISAEVADNHGADADSGRYNKRLIAKDALAAIKKIAGEAMDDHYAMTLPWMDAGARMLPSAAYFSYEATMRAHGERFEAAVAQFVTDYPSHRAQARINLNGLFSETDYPHESEIKSRFTFGFNFFPLPSASDFRVNLGALEIDRIRQQIENSTQAAFEDAVKDVYNRIGNVVGHMAGRLRAYNVTADGVEHPFRDSMVENVRELAALLPALNVTEDAGIAQVSASIAQELCTYDADTLRASQNAREKTADAADAILAAAREFMQ